VYQRIGIGVLQWAQADSVAFQRCFHDVGFLGRSGRRRAPITP
jgi:hypothetical protein